MRKRGNRESTIERKLKHLNGNFEDMIEQILSCKWVSARADKSKSLGLKAVQQYAEFKGFKITVPPFRVYDNCEMFVPSPEMVRRLIYRIRNLALRSAVLLAVETGASASEVLGVTWKDVNLVSRTVTVRGVTFRTR